MPQPPPGINLESGAGRNGREREGKGLEREGSGSRRETRSGRRKEGRRVLEVEFVGGVSTLRKRTSNSFPWPRQGNAGATPLQSTTVSPSFAAPCLRRRQGLPGNAFASNNLILFVILWNDQWDFTIARSKNGDRIRPPPRGGWRGHEWDVHAWEKTSGRGRDGGSTSVRRRGKRDFTPATNEPFVDGPSGSMHRRPPAALPPPPFPFASKDQSNHQSFHRAPPPSRRGANACAHPML